MSWLSELLGYNETPVAPYTGTMTGDGETTEARNARIRAEHEAVLAAERQSAENARIEAERVARAKAAEERARLAGLGKTEADEYFRSRGLDPSTYSSSIQREIDRLLGAGATDYSGVGAGVYGSEEAAARDRALRSIQELFPTGFESKRVIDIAGDQILTDIEAQDRQRADAIVENMLKRQVINPIGVQAAKTDLDAQGSRVRTMLNELGSGILSEGRQKLTNLAGEARQSAGQLPLGSSFDFTGFKQRADETTNDFLSRLGDTVRSQLPTGGLYDTSQLASVAGAGQHAQNLKFDPNALQGIIDEEEDPDKPKRKAAGIF